jgi:hypothetical protein
VLSVKSLLLFVGPIFLPKAISYYRSIRTTSDSGKPIQPVPPYVNRALAILFAISFGALVFTLPLFSPENIFNQTQSRLQIPTDVLFTRLHAIRPNGLTEIDSILRQKLTSLESRLLYFQFGPNIIANCPFCNPKDTGSYLYYAIPAILTPHLFNICAMALVTSGLFVGDEGAVWRRSATIAAISLAALDVWIVSTYDHQANSRATRLEDIDTFFWKMRVYRWVSIAAIDALLGWVIYLSSTNRAFVTPRTAAERIEGATRELEAVRSKINAAGVMRNTVSRDAALRNRSQSYWVEEGRMMAECMEDREVVEGVNNALQSRISIDAISKDAELYSQNLMGAVKGPRSP